MGDIDELYEYKHIYQPLTFNLLIRPSFIELHASTQKKRMYPIHIAI